MAMTEYYEVGQRVHRLRDFEEGTKTVFFMRHGESEANASGHDLSNPGLTAYGKQTAAAWAPEVKLMNLDLVLVSPMRRTLETAAAMKLPVERMRIFAGATELRWHQNQNKPAAAEDVAALQEQLGFSEVPFTTFSAAEVDEEASISELRRFLVASEAKRVLVVTHFLVIKRLTDWTPRNGQIMSCSWSRKGASVPFVQLQCSGHV